MNTHTTNLPAIETHTFPNSHIISCLNLNLAQIAASGQCFRMLPVPEKPGIWSLISGTHYLEISGTPDGFFFDCPDEALPFWKQYFDLGTDYGSFIASIRADDVYLAAAADAGSGIRILRQDLWEMMITFLISQQKTIPKIREAVEALAKKYGAKRTAALSDGSIRTYYSFPSPEELASASLDDLLTLKLGYRAKYIHRLIQDVLAGTVSLESLAALPPDEAMTALTSLYGIGPKVANCAHAGRRRQKSRQLRLPLRTPPHRRLPRRYLDRTDPDQRISSQTPHPLPPPSKKPPVHYYYPGFFWKL